MNRIHVPEPGIRLTRAQRRQVKRNAIRIERLWQADARFFQRFPHRRYRLRLAGQAEVDQQQLFEDGPLDVSPDYRLFMIVKSMPADQRLRLCVVMREETETDLSDDEVRWLWDDCAELSPKVREVEAAMRQRAEEQ